MKAKETVTDLKLSVDRDNGRKKKRKKITRFQGEGGFRGKVVPPPLEVPGYAPGSQQQVYSVSMTILVFDYTIVESRIVDI